MSDSQEKLAQLHATLYGVEGLGGLLREVEDVKDRLDAAEQKLATISAKWLFLMLLAGLLGNALGGSLLTAIAQTLQLGS